MQEQFDLLIKNGHLIDGTGNPYYRADIGIANGQIIRINREINQKGSQRVIQADGSIVSPGFVDTHSHDDLYLLINPTCDEKILQGVTTIVIGNCGFSMTPISEDHRTDIKDTLRVMGGEHLSEEDLEIRSFDDYLRKLEDLKPGINILPLVGHSTVRIAVLGSANRVPTDSELKRMKELVANAMGDGAWGISTGLIYAPGNYAGTDEIIELSKVASQFNGIYASHIRSEGDSLIPALTEAIKIGEEANIPVHVAHHKVIGKNNWGKSVETLKMMAEARARGVEITCDQYPYRAGSTFLAAVLPPSILSDGPEVFSEKLKDPTIRREVIAEIEKGGEGQWENLIKGAGFENLVISASPNHHDYIGRSIADIAKRENKSPYDVIFDLVVEEKRGTIIILFVMSEEDIKRIIQSPFTMIGTDGIPGFGVSKVHPRFTGTFPKVLGRYVREKGPLSLEEAIRKMTSLPAQTFRVKKKGLLKEGFDADIVIFNPKTIIDKSTYEDPKQKPEGISYVLVNGEIAVDNGKVMGATSGKVLRHKKP
ncbi:MAG: D-aminoacylase [Deltaproteobacteria bacterium]|nr:D-aminoacylase [Deltaproteobacteria bacterium]